MGLQRTGFITASDPGGTGECRAYMEAGPSSSEVVYF
jgi:hypothetical protein